MGLKCSVLGHQFGETDVEREREEQGSEVVITIREVDTCERCGAERVVSENKEVTTIATPDEPTPPSAGPSDGEATDPADEPVDTDAPPADADGAADVAEAEADADAAAGPGGDADASAAPAGASDAPGANGDAPASSGGDLPEGEELPRDDAEILEDDDPVDDEGPVDEELADPATPDDPEEPAEDDAVIMDDAPSPEHGGGPERAPGEWPEEPGEDASDADWSPAEDEPTITAPDAGTDANGAMTVPSGSFVCGECGYSTPVESSSLRAGDFCPECHRGTLVHEPDD